MDVLGWSHRTMASWFIRTVQNRALGCLFIHMQMLLQIPDTLAVETPVTTRDQLLHWEILFPMQALPYAKIPPKLFFGFNEEAVLCVCATPYSLKCGKRRDPSITLEAERWFLWRQEQQSNLWPLQKPTWSPSCKLLPWDIYLMGTFSS